jgi:hypothetical protein
LKTLKIETMKTVNTPESKIANDIFNEFLLSNEEMTCVRGGDNPSLPNMPPVII